MTDRRYAYAYVHFLHESDEVQPLCRRIDTHAWNWTLEAAAVTCERCRTLLAQRAGSSSGDSTRAA